MVARRTRRQAEPTFNLFIYYVFKSHIYRSSSLSRRLNVKYQEDYGASREKLMKARLRGYIFFNVCMHFMTCSTLSQS